MGEAEQVPAGSAAAVVNAWGEWQWSDAVAQRAMEEAGFVEVAVPVLPVFSKALLVRGTKPAAATVEAEAEAARSAARIGG